MKLIENEIVWTCTPTIECGYDETLHRTRQVKLKIGQHGVFYGHAFNEESGEVDTDSNATIFARESNCFATKKEANDHYAANLTYEIAAMQSELEDFNKRRED